MVQLTAAIMSLMSFIMPSSWGQTEASCVKNEVKWKSRLPFTKLLSYRLFPLDSSTIIEPWQVNDELYPPLQIVKLLFLSQHISFFSIIIILTVVLKSMAGFNLLLVLKCSCDTLNRLLEMVVTKSVWIWKVTGLIHWLWQPHVLVPNTKLLQYLLPHLLKVTLGNGVS